MAEVGSDQERRSPQMRTPWVRRSGEDEPVFEKVVVPTVEDYRAVQRPDGHLPDATPVLGFMALLGLSVGSFFAFPAWRREDYATLAILVVAGLLAGLLAGYLLILLFRWLGAKIFASELREQGAVDIPVRLRFDRSGIETEASGMVVNVAWSSLVDTEEDDRRYYFWISTKQAVSIAKDAFADEGERKAFDNALLGWYGRAPRTPPRMARERSLPPETASEPKTDNP